MIDDRRTDVVRDITAHPPGLDARKFKDSAFIIWGIVATVIGLGTLVALVSELLQRRRPPPDGGVLPELPVLRSRRGRHSLGLGRLAAGDRHDGAVRHPDRHSRRHLSRRIRAEEPVTSAIEIAVNNLAGVPSILFGLMAVGIFVQFLGNPARWFSLPARGLPQRRRRPVRPVHPHRRHHALAPDPAGHHRRHARSRARRAAGNPPRRARRRRHQVADDAASRAALCAAGRRHRRHHRHFARAGRNRAADHDRRAHLRGVPAHHPSGRRHTSRSSARWTSTARR